MQVHQYHHYQDILTPWTYYDSLSPSIPFGSCSWKVFWKASSYFSQPTLVCPCLGVHKRTLLKILSLFHLQCSTYPDHRTWMICEIRGKWPCSRYFVRCCFQDFLKTTHSILVLILSSFFSEYFLEFKWCNYRVVQTQLEFKLYFIREVRFPYGQ